MTQPWYGVAEILKEMPPMWIAACTLGFNELAKNAKTPGDRLYFLSFRDILHEALQKSGSDWSIEFKPAVTPQTSAQEVLPVPNLNRPDGYPSDPKFDEAANRALKERRLDEEQANDFLHEMDKHLQAATKIK